MYESAQKTSVVNLRVVNNALVFTKGNATITLEYMGPGVYQFTSTEPIEWNEVNIRCLLFGNPVAPD
jgi:hypothetical protein